jgi:tetratricopeptide (TPR) repeat protein/tRNA A-37 threonylcarbamoyl transferase component Bud32
VTSDDARTVDVAPALEPGEAPRIVLGGRIGRYVAGEQIGHGGMGVVVRARDPELDREVALKLLLPGRDREGSTGSHAARLLREARAIARVSHPNIVEVFDVGEHEGRIFMAMELVTGQTLRELLARTPRPPWSDIASVLAQAARGLMAAHRAELVHRDFKPANVIAGDDGRVRVLDFGLATLSSSSSSIGAEADADLAEDSLGSGASRHSGDRLTMTGYVMGTPAYMAPEQHRGGAPDQRSDQFSFAVTVFEALFGRRPFAKNAANGVDPEILAGRFPALPAGVRPGPRLLSALRVALATDPRARHPDLSPLVAALEAGSAERGVGLRMTLAVGAVLLAGTGIFALATKDDPCAREVGERADATWSPARERAIASAFEDSGLAYAESEWARLVPRIERRAESLRAAELELCTAESDPALVQMRMRCLHTRRTALQATLDVLADADSDTIARATAVVAALPRIEPCMAPGLSGFDEAEIEADGEIERDLALLSALEVAGRLAEAEPLARNVVVRADTVAAPVLQARARHRLGRIEMGLDALDAARDDLTLAYHAAVGAGYDELAADAATDLIELVGTDQRKPEDAATWVRHARTAVERLGSDDLRRASLLNNEGMLASEKGDFEVARARIAASLELRRRLLPELHITVARSVQNLAAVEVQLGRFDEALPLLEHSVELYRGLHGDEHPNVAAALHNLGAFYFERRMMGQAREVHERTLAMRQRILPPDSRDIATSMVSLANAIGEQGDFETARAYYEQALEIRSATLPPEHPDVAGLWTDIGITWSRAGRFTEAREAMLKGLEGRRAALGPDHPDVALAWANLGVVAQLMDDFDTSEHDYGEALRIFELRLGPEHPYVAMTLNNLAAVTLAQGGHARALGLYERALAIHHAGSAGENQTLAILLTGLGRSQLGLSRHEEAIASLEEALRLVEATKLEPRLAVETRFALAMALWEQPSERARAHEVGQAAQEHAQALGPAEAELRAEIEAWVAAHGRAEG